MKSLLKKCFAVILIAAAALMFVSCNKGDDKDMGDITPKTIKRTWEAGVVDNNVYRSTFAGIQFTPASEKWTFAGEQELLDSANIVIDMDMLNDIQKKNLALSKEITVYDMMMTDADTGSKINVIYSNMSKVASDAGEMTGQRYTEAMASKFRNMELFKSVSQPKQVEYCGEVYYRVDMDAEYDTVSMKQIFLGRLEGDYYINITFSATSQDVLDVMYGMGSALS